MRKNGQKCDFPTIFRDLHALEFRINPAYKLANYFAAVTNYLPNPINYTKRSKKNQP